MCNMCTRDTRDEVSQDTRTQDAQDLPKMPPRVSRMLQKMKTRHNIVTDPADAEKQKEVAYQPDLLAVSTQFSKIAYDLFKTGVVHLQESKAYVIATRTPQPVHVALALVVLLACLTRPGSDTAVKAWTALYVGAVATHLGTQVWMTLISGVVLFFSLPRHEFGRVQTVLFPVYYVFEAAVSLLAALAYFRAQYLTKFENTSWIQLALLLAVFSIEAYVRVRLVHPMLRAKHVKTQMEETAGGGHEVGKLILGELAHCPRYLRVLRTFRTYHSTIAMGTLITLGCSVYSTMIIVDSMCR